MFDNSNCCNPCCNPCCDPRCNGSQFGDNIWVWVIVAIVIIWIFSGNNNCY